MLVKGTSKDRATDLFAQCRELKLIAATPEEGELLAELARMFLRGGTLSIEAEEREAFYWTQETPE